MASDITRNYLENAQKQFLYYRILAEKTFSQLEDKDLFMALGDDTNSIAVIVQHLSGNMLSRWTDFLTTDGEKSFRQRDEEFEVHIQTREEMMEAWRRGWECQNDGISTVNNGNFNTVITIRGINHTVLEAINRQIAHVSYHIGQIVLIGHAYKGGKWKSLSIARGQSKAFNDKHFEVDQNSKHWADATIESYSSNIK